MLGDQTRQVQVPGSKDPKETACCVFNNCKVAVNTTGKAILQSSGLLFACSQAGNKDEERDVRREVGHCGNLTVYSV